MISIKDILDDEGQNEYDELVSSLREPVYFQFFYYVGLVCLPGGVLHYFFLNPTDGLLISILGALMLILSSVAGKTRLGVLDSFMYEQIFVRTDFLVKQKDKNQ